MIYRVTIRTTNSVQLGSGGTFWAHSVAYCGTSLEDARIAYLTSRPNDYGGGYGNPSKETVIEAFESEPDDIESDEAEEVEAIE